MGRKTIITCDICDKVIEGGATEKYFEVCFYPCAVDGLSDKISYDETEFTLCPECAAKVLNYIRNLKEDYNAQ